MNISKFEKLSAKLVFTVAAIGLTLFAGAKHGSPTNTPPVGGGVLAAPQSLTNEISFCGDCGVPGGHALPSLQIMLGQPPPSTSTFNLNLITNWHARGAWIDWTRISFPSGFRFPIGTNFIREVTLMSYGEIRTSLRGQTLANFSQLPATSCQLPTLLALQPGVSSTSYGLTASNSFLFAWENVCVERNPTNRVNASIELFANGSIVTRFGDWEGCAPAQPPPGFVGDGQDDAWVTNAFPALATNILAQGYETWLANQVGVDEQNGRYQAAVTIPALPQDGSPCYLVCGSYKVNVTAPGTYRFPLEVFETCEVYTTPTSVPFSIDFDDGYTGDGTSYEIVEVPDTPPLLMMAAVHLFSPPTFFTSYRFYMQPIVIVTPDMIPLSTAEGTHVSVWCNIGNVTRRFFRAVSQEFYLNFCFPSDAEIIEAEVEDLVEIILENSKGSASGCFSIVDDDDDDDDPDEPEEPERENATVFTGESLHTEVTNDCAVTYLTAVTADGSTTAGEAMTSVGLVGYPAADVYVYMATTESGTDEYDDAVSWTVMANGTPVLQGQASVSDYAGVTGGSTYGVSAGAVLVGGGHYTAPADDILRLRCQCSAQNVGDGKKQTCVQIVVVPVE